MGEHSKNINFFGSPISSLLDSQTVTYGIFRHQFLDYQANNICRSRIPSHPSFPKTNFRHRLNPNNLRTELAEIISK